MSTIKPFKAYRPANNQFATQIAALPYDVVNTAEAKQLALNNPYSFFHISRAEIDLPQNINPYTPEVYQQALKAFDSFVNQNVMIQDAEPKLYIYAQTMHQRTQTGIVCLNSTLEYDSNIIKKHEFTRPEKEQDRINHITTTQLHTEPILMAYYQVNEIDQIINQITQTQNPDYEFTAPDNIKHTFWVINNTLQINELVQLFETKVPALYIADGHHRAASSAKVAQYLKNQNPTHTGKEEYNFFLSVVFPHNQLHIYDYNRVVKDLNGLTQAQFFQALEPNFTIQKLTQATAPQKPYHYSLYLNNEWFSLVAKPHTYAHATNIIQQLDVWVLSQFVLEPILGIADQRTDKRIDFVGGIRGLSELERRVNNKEMQLAFALHPCTLEQVMEVSNNNNVMPPKSTWFEPKLRSGLAVHNF